jgi:hypothetical protein
MLTRSYAYPPARFAQTAVGSRVHGRLRPRRSHATSSQGHPRAIFRRAIDRGNLILAETSAREVGRLTLTEALELTALYAKRDRQRFPRAAARWLQRWLDEWPPATIEEACLVSSALAALGGPRHAEAMGVLLAMAGPAVPGPAIAE